MKIIAMSLDALNRKNYVRYGKTKGIFNKKSMRIINRKHKAHIKSPMQKFCHNKIDDSCVLRAIKSNKASLRKSANFIQTLRKISGSKVSHKNRFNMSKRTKNRKLYDRKHKVQLHRIIKARKHHK